MYRPEGWDNPEKAEHERLGDSEYGGSESKAIYEAYEAGADAMLEDINDWLKPLGLVFKQYPDESGLYHISGRDDKW